VYLLKTLKKSPNQGVQLLERLKIEYFLNAGFELAYSDEGSGIPILLIHGFASSMAVNWVSSGWVATLLEAGYRVIAFDNRGHGHSTKSYQPQDYTPSKMASDAKALLTHLNIQNAHIMGYSMGARVSAFMAFEYPSSVKSVILGGLGLGLVEGVGDWGPIAHALTAENSDEIKSQRGLMFRTFAERTNSDRMALAACIEASRVLVNNDQLARIKQPVLIAVGSKDDLAGDASGLAKRLHNGTAFVIERRDHMLAVGDASYKKAVLEYLKKMEL
jgi:pimeloyl-ACP methyl ester carboxylesterase